MRPRPFALALALSAALAVGCSSPEQPADDDGPDATAPADEGTEAGTLVGVLEGDAQLEGGCVWIEPTGGRDAELGDRVEPLLPEGVAAEFEPDLRLVGPQGEVIAERGDELVLQGEPAGDVVTICQVGPAYRVDEITGTVGR